MARRHFPDEGAIWLTPNEVHRDPEVNRFYEEPRAQAMFNKGFDPKRARSAGYCVSTRADGSHIWLDGQHRGEAAKMADQGDVKVPCYELTGLTKEQEAEWVLLFQEDRKRTSPADAHRLGVKARRAIDLELVAICRKHNLTPDGTAKDGHLAAVAKVRKIIEQENGGVILDEALGTLIESFGNVAAAMEGTVIQGMARVYAKHNGNLNRPALVKKLAKRSTPSALLGSARSARDLHGGSIAANVGNTIIATYNRGRSTGKLEQL